MNFPPEGLNVYIKHPVTSDWEMAYYRNGNWWKGVDDSPQDIIIDYQPAEWKDEI
jgi:hypothetical protein